MTRLSMPIHQLVQHSIWGMGSSEQ